MDLEGFLRGIIQDAVDSSSISAVARNTGVDRSVVSRFLSGDSKNITLDTINKFLAVYADKFIIIAQGKQDPLVYLSAMLNTLPDLPGHKVKKIIDELIEYYKTKD